MSHNWFFPEKFAGIIELAECKRRDTRHLALYHAVRIAVGDAAGIGPLLNQYPGLADLRDLPSAMFAIVDAVQDAARSARRGGSIETLIQQRLQRDFR